MPLALRRTPLLLKQGELDGDFMRAQAYFDAHPELLRVKAPLRSMTYWLHAKPPCARTVSAEELARSRVSYQSGTALVEANLPSLEAAVASMRRYGTLAQLWAKGDVYQEAWQVDPKATRPKKGR